MIETVNNIETPERERTEERKIKIMKPLTNITLYKIYKPEKYRL